MFENSPERIAFGQRFLAALLDIAAITVIGMVAIPLLLGITWLQKGELPGSVDNQMSNQITNIIMGAFFVLGVIEACTGYTPGKFVMGLRAGTTEGHKGSVGFYISRYLAKNLWVVMSLLAISIHAAMGATPIVQALNTVQGFIFLVFLVGCFFALRMDKQALHDKLAKSAVYRKNDLT